MLKFWKFIVVNMKSEFDYKFSLKCLKEAIDYRVASQVSISTNVI